MTESRSIGFRQVQRTETARIRHVRACTAEGRPVPWDGIAEGYELPDCRALVLTNDDSAELPLPSARTIEVAEFASTGPVDSIMFDRSCFLQP